MASGEDVCAHMTWTEVSSRLELPCNVDLTLCCRSAVAARSLVTQASPTRDAGIKHKHIKPEWSRFTNLNSGSETTALIP